MPKITPEERAGAIELLPAAQTYDADMDNAFNEFVDSLDSSVSTSTIWVHRIPLDERGEVITNAKHIHLFSAPLDRYKLEEIISKVKTDFMQPTERVACIRIIARVEGQRGNAFNRVIMLEKELQQTRHDDRRENLADILRVIQDSNAQSIATTRQMFQEFLQLQQQRQQAPTKDPIETAIALVGAMSGMLGNLTKPAGGGDLLSQIQTLKALKDLSGDLVGAPSDAGPDDSTAGVIRAVAPLAVPFLEFLKSQPSQPQPARVPSRPMLPAPSPTAGPRPDPAQISGRPPDPSHVSGFGIDPTRPTPAPAPQLQSEEQKVIAELQAQLKAICESAAQGGDAEGMATMIVQQLPEGSEAETNLLTLLDSPNWIGQLAAVYPPVNNYKEYFQRMRDAILAAYDVEPAAGPTATPAQ